MKNYNQNNTFKNLVTATAVLGFVAVPLVLADKNQPAATDKDRAPLTTEVTQTFVEGYTVPSQHRTHFTELPAIEEEKVVVRYHNGRAYYVNSDNWTIQRVVELDPSIKLDKDSSVYVEGYMIPEAARTRFIDVPKPEGKMSVRYYNNTAYYMDSDFRIVRTVKLSR